MTPQGLVRPGITPSFFPGVASPPTPHQDPFQMVQTPGGGAGDVPEAGTPFPRPRAKLSGGPSSFLVWHAEQPLHPGGLCRAEKGEGSLGR